MVVMGTAASPGSPSTFRNVALVTSSIAAILLLLCAVAVARYGSRIRDFGWISNRAGGVLVIGRVAAGGPADGLVQSGDEIVAWDGDRRVARVGVLPFRRNLPPDADYTLTIRRAGLERTVTLTAPARASDDQLWLAISNLLAAAVWIAVATTVAFFRPELAVSRSAYGAGMMMGFLMLWLTRGSVLPWLPPWWRTALILVVPLSPLHLALAYDFNMRFPPGVSTTRLWRGIRIGLYVLCGMLFVRGPLIDTLMYNASPERIVSVRYALHPIERWLAWPAAFVFPLAVAAIIAVVTRNYRTVHGEDDRRRLRWVLWGTILGLTPFLTFRITTLALNLAGIPAEFARWNAFANLATVLIPIAFAYAIIKHHVFDIRFVVRRGLQYLLAKNALRFLLALPIVGLAYGLVVHRAEPIGQLLWTHSPYLYLIGAAMVSLRFRSQLTGWVDRRFFREAYDRQRILVELSDNIEKLETASSVSKLVSHELEAVFHPECLFVWYREGDEGNLSLAYSSGGDIQAAELSPASPLLQLAERAGTIVELPLAEPDALPHAERERLDQAGVRLIVPMVGTERHLVGLLILGDKKSDEPYSSDDQRLLQAVARQIAVARENVRLKDRVDQDRRLRHDVLAHLETGHVNVLKECPTCGSCYDAASLVCPADGRELTLSLPVERTIDGKYRLDHLIGRGGMGAVYEAADLRLGRSVAVKIMLGRAFGNRQALRRFEREAQACARLTHPNIITVFDFGGIGADGAFLVMELVQGRTLRTELNRRGQLSPAVTAVWFEQICAAAAAAHHRRIVHRDLKPENVLIASTATGSEIVKVLDFGVAKMRTATDETDDLTNTGVVLGTAGYIAPEQLSGGEVDHRADVFAIGVMTAEAIVGRRPFPGRTYAEQLTSIVNDRVELGGNGVERRRLELVLRRATASDPAARYASIGAFAGDLIPALHALATALADPPQTTFPRDSGHWPTSTRAHSTRHGEGQGSSERDDETR